MEVCWQGELTFLSVQGLWRIFGTLHRSLSVGDHLRNGEEPRGQPPLEVAPGASPGWPCSLLSCF